MIEFKLIPFISFLLEQSQTTFTIMIHVNYLFVNAPNKSIMKEFCIIFYFFL